MITKIKNYFINRKASKEFEKHWKSLMLEAGNDSRAAIFEIGMLYENGVGVKKDMEMATKYYLHAAELGMNEAQRKIAGWYERGVNLELDLIKALMWYRKCSESNNFDDAMSFACLCANPKIDHSIVKDYISKAIEILKIGVENGDVEAMCYYGSLLLRNLVPGGTMEQGFQLLKMAAFKGQSDAQIYLGDACAQGIVTEKDLVEAKRWYEIALKNSNPEAQKRMDAI